MSLKLIQSRDHTEGVIPATTVHIHYLTDLLRLEVAMLCLACPLCVCVWKGMKGVCNIVDTITKVLGELRN